MGLFRDEVYTQNRSYRLGEELPYFEFDNDPDSLYYRYHLLEDGSLGICWKTNVPGSYSFDNGHLTTTNEWRTFVEGLPTGFEAQMIITSTNDLRRKMKPYLKSQAPNEKAITLRKSRAEKLIDSGKYGYLQSVNSRTMLRDTSMVICVRTPPSEEMLGILQHVIGAVFAVVKLAASFIGPLEQMLTGILDKAIKAQLGEFREVVMSAETTLTSLFELERMSLEDLKAHYWTAMCPSYREDEQDERIDPHVPIKDQMLPLPIEQDFDIVKMGDDYHGVIMLALMPDAVATDYLGIIRRVSPTQTTFFCNMRQANQGAEQVSLTVNAAIRQRMASVFNREEAQIVQQETSQVKHRMFEGRRIMYAQVGVIVHGYSRQEVEDTLLRINSAFKKLSVVPDIERSMTLQAITYSWPLVFRNKYAKPFARSRRVLSDDLCDLLPLHGHWGGHTRTQAVYTNRDGEVTYFDHTHPEFVNWHYVITGTSGSGKSFAVVDLTLQLWAGGVQKQYLMTIKDDYDRFAETLGRLILVDVDRPDACINPYAGEMTKTRLQSWVGSLDLMLKGGAGGQTSQEEYRLLELVIQYAYELVKEGDVLRPSVIREAFQKYPYGSIEARDAGLRWADILGSYCQGGIYGKMFDGPPSVTEKDGLVVFNLQNVLNEKISDVIVNSIFNMLDNVMYQGDRKERKHLLVDEMISMINSSGGAAVAGQLKRAFRTYRSLNCMCGIATQNEEDLTSDVGQAIIGNITKRIMLKPRKEMIPMLLQSLSLRGDRHQANLESLETRPGYYSEFYLMSPHGEVVCRLLTDRLSYALSTTTPDDTAEIQRLTKENGGDAWAAVVKFSEIYPNGVRAAKAAQEQ